MGEAMTFNHPVTFTHPVHIHPDKGAMPMGVVIKFPQPEMTFRAPCQWDEGSL